LWVVGIQYFVVGLFDFHRARAPDGYWILESFPPRMPGCSAALFLDLGLAASSCMRSRCGDLRLSNEAEAAARAEALQRQDGAALEARAS
jgi:hypothetical protein